jgi:hypothetical protein
MNKPVMIATAAGPNDEGQRRGAGDAGDAGSGRAGATLPEGVSA